MGKLHVHPRRNRIGFDKVIFNEEGRSTNGGGRDDWEKDLDARGFGGQAYATGGCNNDYLITPWHLPWDLHPTNWTARRACSLIRDLDPGRPAFLYVSFTAPHPPLWTMPAWTELYDGADIDAPVRGDWTRNPPFRVRAIAGKAASMRQATAREIAAVRRAFYSQLTHLDRQIRFILGTLREQGRLEHTIIAFTSDHGDMLGDHGMWSKGLMYEGSARVPLLIAPPAARSGQARGATDPRIAELRDIMPTLLSMAGLPVPARLDGIDLFSGERRDYLFGELGQGAGATRMVRDERHKLVYYAEGNRRQLFDLQEDPRELRDLAESKSHRGVLRRMTRQLAGELYGESLGWLDGDRLRGWPACTGRTAAQLEFLRPARPRSRLTGNRPEPDGGRAQTFSAAIRPRPAWWSPRQAGRKGGIFPAGCGPDG